MASRSDAPPGSPVRAADAPGPGDPPGSVASEEETPASDATEASPEAPARASADAALASSRGMAFAYNRHHVPPVPPDPPAVSRAGPTPLIDPSAVPEVLRAVALEDGCVKVNFRDNTVLALDPTGAAFTAHAPDGESVRQLADPPPPRGTPLLACSGARGASPSRGGAATRRPRRGRAS